MLLKQNMPKTLFTNSECRSDKSCNVKSTVFHCDNSTVDNIEKYLTWKVLLLENELKDELLKKRQCCKHKRPRCQLCYEKRSWQKYDNTRRKFIALSRIKDINLRQKTSINTAFI